MIGLEHVKANGRRILSEDDYRSLEDVIGNTSQFLQSLLNMLNERVQELEENGGGVEGDFDGDGLPDVTMDKINKLIDDATILLNSATAVSELAITAKDKATGAAFNASVSETKAVEYRDDAENAAVRAAASTTVAASIATGGDLLGNPILEKWDEEALYPDAWGTTVIKPEYFSKLEGESRYGSQVLRANVLTATECTIATASLTDKYYFSNYYVLEAEVELIEGEIDGAAVIVEHNNNVSFRSILPFGTHAVKSGDFYKIRRVIAVPFVADEASFTHFKVIYAPNIIDGGELTIKDIYLHKLAIRPASTEEIRTFNVQSEIYASITEEMEVLVSETGQVGAKYGVKVDLNGYVTGYGLLATNNDGVPTSEMIFSVDSFKIVKPTGPGDTGTPLTMFSVGVHNGVPSLVINGVVYGDGSIGGPAIAPQVINAQHITTGELITLSAQIGDALINNAHINELSADKLIAGTAIANTITVNGRPVGSMSTTDALYDIITGDWTRVAGFSGSTISYSTDSLDVLTGSRSIVSNTDGAGWWISPDIVAFDPSKLYRITFRVRNVSGDNTGQLYLGLVGYAGDKITKVNTTGGDSYSLAHYVSAFGINQSTVLANFTDYVGYVKGSDVTGTSGVGTVAAPSKLHQNVRFIRPLAIFNYNLGAGVGTRIALDSVKIEVLPAEAAEIINAGTTTIDGGKITTNSIDTLQLKADSVTTDILATGAVTADNIAAGAVTTDKITIGNAANWLENSDLSAGVTNWTLVPNVPAAFSALGIRNDTYAPYGGVLQVQQTTGDTGATYYADLLPATATGVAKQYAVEVGKRYQFSAYLFSHRSAGRLYIAWYNAAGSIISYSSSSFPLSQNNDPTKLLANYQRCSLFANPPVGAISATPFIRKDPTNSGVNSYLWITRPMFGEANASQTELSPWAPSGITTISEGHIKTAKLDAGLILQNGTLLTDLIAANAISNGASVMTTGTSAVATTEVTLQSCTITLTSTASKVSISGSFNLERSIGNVIKNNNANQVTTLFIRIYRGTTLLHTTAVFQHMFEQGVDFANIYIGNTAYSIDFVDLSPVSGSNTYHMKAQTSVRSFTMENRFLSLLELKK